MQTPEPTIEHEVITFIAGNPFSYPLSGDDLRPITDTEEARKRFWAIVSADDCRTGMSLFRVTRTYNANIGMHLYSNSHPVESFLPGDPMPDAYAL